MSKMSFRDSFPIRRFRTVSCQLQPRLLLRCCCPLDFNGCNECCICGNGTREHALQDAPHTGFWRTDERVLSSVDQPSGPRGTPSDQAFPGKVTCATANTPTHWHGYAVRLGYMFCGSAQRAKLVFDIPPLSVRLRRISQRLSSAAANPIGCYSRPRPAALVSSPPC